MSIEFARAMKTAAAGFAAAAVLFVQPSAAGNIGITRFAVKNCTDAKVLICAYDKTDNILAIPYDAKTVGSGNRRRFSCGSANRCKVFSAVSSKDIKKIVNGTVATAVGAPTAAAGAAYAGIASYGAYMWAANGTAASAASGTVAGLAGILVVAGSGALGVMASIDAVKASDACKKALKDSRQLISDATDADAKQAARDGLKRTLSGSWPNYKNYSFVTQDNGVPALVEGDKC
jgi:hypothetical protein